MDKFEMFLRSEMSARGLARGNALELSRAAGTDGYLAESDEVWQSAQQVRWLPERCRKLMPNKKHATRCMQQRAAQIRQITADCSSIGDGTHGRSTSTPPGPRR